MSKPILSLVVTAVALLWLPLRADTQRADLSGVWVLNPELSDDPRAEREDRGDKDDDDKGRGRFGRPRIRIGAGGGGGPLTGPGMGGPMTGPGGMRREDPEEMQRVGETMQRALEGSARLTITQDGDRLVITGADGSVEKLEADGKKHKEISPTNLELERKTKWDDGELVTEVTVKDSAVRYKQTYEIRGAALTIITKVDGPPGEDRTIKRLYERETAQ